MHECGPCRPHHISNHSTWAFSATKTVEKEWRSKTSRWHCSTNSTNGWWWWPGFRNEDGSLYTSRGSCSLHTIDDTSKYSARNTTKEFCRNTARDTSNDTSTFSCERRKAWWWVNTVYQIYCGLALQPHFQCWDGWAETQCFAKLCMWDCQASEIGNRWIAVSILCEGCRIFVKIML